MTISFRPAVRENVGLIIGLAGSSGSGKTYTAMRLASGISGSKPFAVIDADNRRALHYADKFKFDHAELRAPFTPDAYAEAILAADKAGYPVIVVDPMSLVWSGEGGVLDWQESELDRMAGTDWKKREACKMAAWIKPKLSHKHMVQKLLQVRAHLILLFRAEEKVDIVKGDDGKIKIVPKVSNTGLNGWVPISEKNLPYELTASFLLTADAPGIPKPIKLQEQHRALFPLDKPITEESGRLIAQWASGGKSAKPKEPAAAQGADAAGGSAHPGPGSKPDPATAADPACITDEQIAAIETRCTEHGISIDRVKAAAKVGALAEIQASRYAGAMKWLGEQIDAMETT